MLPKLPLPKPPAPLPPPPYPLVSLPLTQTTSTYETDEDDEYRLKGPISQLLPAASIYYHNQILASPSSLEEPEELIHPLSGPQKSMRQRGRPVMRICLL